MKNYRRCNFEELQKASYQGESDLWWCAETPDSTNSFSLSILSNNLRQPPDQMH